MASCVPLQLHHTDTIRPLWKNKACNSTSFCRPIRFTFEKETVELTKLFVGDIEKEIQPTKIEVQGLIAPIFVTHKLQMTMIDGKVSNTLSDTKSSAQCNICGALPSEMNDPRVFDRPENLEGSWGNLSSPLKNTEHGNVSPHSVPVRYCYRQIVDQKLHPSTANIKSFFWL